MIRVKKSTTSPISPALAAFLILGSVAAGLFLYSQSVYAAAPQVIGAELRDGGLFAGCPGSSNGATYATDVGATTSWEGDTDNFDPDCLRVLAGNTIPKDLDIRIGIQARDVNTPCGFLWLFKCGDGGGIERYTPWASEGFDPGWSPWTGDTDMYAPDQWRFIVDTRPRYGYTVSDFKLGVETSNGIEGGGGGNGGCGGASDTDYTASSSEKGQPGWTGWSSFSFIGSNHFNCVRMKLLATSTLNDPTAVLIGTSTAPLNNSVNIVWDVEYIDTVAGCTLTGYTGGSAGPVVDADYDITANGRGTKTSVAITEPITYTLNCAGFKTGSTVATTQTITPYAATPPVISLTMDPVSGLSAGSTSISTIAVTNNSGVAQSCSIVGKDIDGATIDTTDPAFTAAAQSATYTTPTTQETIYLTSGTSWTVPYDWNPANNTIEVIGGGGSGQPDTGSGGKGGGGGGAYSKTTNLWLIPGSVVTYQVASTSASAGIDGGDTYFNGTGYTCGSQSVCAKGGKAAPGGSTGGAGGAAASGIGTVKYSGGNGGTLSNAGWGGAGGGGAAGPYGDGKNGGRLNSSGNQGGAGGGGAGGDSSTAGSNVSGSGGGAGGKNRNGDAAAAASAAGVDGGGGGGTSQTGNCCSNVAAGNGGAGIEWDATHGAGGGGGGGADNNDGKAGDGGLYGGGGGGAGDDSNGIGTGAQGVIVIKYTHAVRNTIYLTTGTTWVVPQDWNNTANSVEVIGGGGSGRGGGVSEPHGGGGGAYSQIVNLSLTPGASVTYQVGSGGVAAAGAVGTAGGDTYFNGTGSTCAAQSVCAKGGAAGTNNAGGAGGAAASGVGTVTYSGGGSGDGASGNGKGGGGAGGAYGDGANGNDIDGGSSDAGYGGAGGTGSPATAGSPGTEWNATHGSGGGGGGGNSGAAGGAAGAYGGGGGGADDAGSSAGGNGGQGIVVIRYTPQPLTTTKIYLTSNTGDCGANCWTVPADWNSSANTIEVIGAGGGGASGSTNFGGSGGGGGGYSKVANLALTPGAQITYAVGQGGLAGISSSNNALLPGQAGGDTFFRRTSGSADTCADTSSACAKGGSGGNVATPGAGGASASGIGETKYSGGVGGERENYGGGGGGGAAGPLGAGGAASTGGGNHGSGGGGGGNGGGSAGAFTGNAWNGGDGGDNAAGTGGADGTRGTPGANGANGGGGAGGGGDNSSYGNSGPNGRYGGMGGAGTEWDATHGSGGGGGGGGTLGNSTVTSRGGAGGLYGGGGGGGGGNPRDSNSGGADGSQGIIVITYSEITSALTDNTTSHNSTHTIGVTTDFTVTCLPSGATAGPVRVLLANCSLDGVTITDGGSANFHSAQTPPAGQTCADLIGSRGCSGGQLTGSAQYQYASCSVLSPIVITANGHATSTSVRKGTSSVAVSWDGGNAESCTITGTDGLLSNEISATASTTITQKTVYTAVCVKNGVTSRASVIVNILPAIKEI